MNRKPFINEKAFMIAQNTGRKKLHLQLLLLIFFLLVYMSVGFLTIQTLFDEAAVVQYCIQAGIELILWLICIVILWGGLPIGRTLFTICTISSFYAAAFMIPLLQQEMEDMITNIIRLIFIIFYLCKSLTLVICSIHLYQPPIVYVWETYAKEGQAAEEEDRVLIQRIMEEHDAVLKQKQSRREIIRKAQHNLRMYTILLAVFLYGALLVFYFAGYVVRYLFPYDGIGIDYAQRYVLLSSLFSALVWSLPAVMMFLYKRLARPATVAAWLFEVIRVLTSFNSTYNMIQSQHYGMPSIGMIIIMEGIRFFILLRISLAFFRDPFINASWKRKSK